MPKYIALYYATKERGTFRREPETHEHYMIVPEHLLKAQLEIIASMFNRWIITALVTQEIKIDAKAFWEAAANEGGNDAR